MKWKQGFEVLTTEPGVLPTVPLQPQTTGLRKVHETTILRQPAGVNRFQSGNGSTDTCKTGSFSSTWSSDTLDFITFQVLQYHTCSQSD